MEELGRSVLKDLGCWAQTDHQREREVRKDLGCWEAKTAHQRESKEHSQADQAGEVRFEGFGLLSGQNEPPEGAQGAQPSKPRWRGPLWSIWSAQRTKWSTRERKEKRPTASSRVMRLVPVCVQEHGRYNPWKSWGSPFWRIWAAKRPKRTTRQSKERRRADQEWKLGRSVLEDLGRSADKKNGVPERERSTEAQPQEKGGHKTKEQPGKPALRRISAALLPRRATRNSKEHRQANQDWESWEVRFEGFGPLSGQNGQPERARSTAKQMKSRRARKVRFDGLGQLSGQNGAPEGERSTEAEPREKGAEQLGKPALGKPQKRKVDVTRPNTRHTRRPSMAQSATPATQNPTSRHNRGTASQLRKRVRVTDEEDFRVTDEGLSL